MSTRQLRLRGIPGRPGISSRRVSSIASLAAGDRVMDALEVGGRAGTGIRCRSQQAVGF